MPRDVNGVYTLPTGNPVTGGTTVESAWANVTMADVAAELTNSLDRFGKGGMLAPFRLADGSLAQPGLAFMNEVTSGFRRAAGGDVRISITAQDVMRWLAGQAQVFVGGVWSDVITQTSLDAQGFATQAWVNSQGYATQAWVNSQGYATQAWVTSQGYVTQANVDAQGYAKLAVAQSFTALQTFTLGINLGNGTLAASNANTALAYKGNVTDGALAIAHKFVNANALVTTGAKLASFYSDNGVTERAWFDKDGRLFSTALLALPTYSLTLKGQHGDSASTVGVILDQVPAPSIAGGKLVSVRANGVEKASFDKDGYLSIGTGVYLHGGGYVYAANHAARNAGDTLTLAGRAADGAAAVGTILDNWAALATAGAKLASIRNNGSEKAYFDKDGNLYTGGLIVATQSFVTSQGYLTQAGVDANGYAKLAVAQTFTAAQTFSAGIQGPLAVAGNVTVTGTLTTTSTLSAGNGTGLLRAGTITNVGANAGVTINGNRDAADAGSDIVLNSLNTRTAGKLLSIQNGGVEKGSFDANGNFTIVGKVTAGDLIVQTTVYAANFLAKDAGAGVALLGQATDGASAVGAVVGNYTALAAGGSKLLSIRNAGVEKAYFDANGWLNAPDLLTVPVHTAIFTPGKPTAGAIMANICFTLPLRLPSGLAGSLFLVGTNPTAATTLTLRKRTYAGAVTDIGTLAFQTNGGCVVTFAGQVDFALGDSLRVVAPGTQDATAADFSLSFKLTRI